MGFVLIPILPPTVKLMNLLIMGGVKIWHDIEKMVTNDGKERIFSLPTEQNNVMSVLPELISYSSGPVGQVKVKRRGGGGDLM